MFTKRQTKFIQSTMTLIDSSSLPFPAEVNVLCFQFCCCGFNFAVVFLVFSLCFGICCYGLVLLLHFVICSGVFSFTVVFCDLFL